ncbi:hypothetical protein SCHPADRAFT_871410 [Schizopora paradoxa]|uniref:FAD-binding FR-type domain-containing protein n=1 Tax=Schizopora paradoxa TaxID=27342 RepID=A0A0H2RU98_9AGAM|nr:hypothetical protein SCHPADRAFT_871410 [Schizopora paradoxa]
MTISDQDIVYWVDLAFIAAACFAFLLTLPRRFIRFSTPLERNVSIKLLKGSPPIERPAEDTSSSSPVDSVTSTIPTDDGRGGLYRRSAAAASPTKRHRGFLLEAASRVRSCLQSFTLFSVTSEKTAGRLVFIFLYIVAIVAACFAHTDPFAKPNRLGFVVASQIPIAVALSTKTSIVTLLTSKGYEKLNFLHRCVGITIFVVANFHFLGHIYGFALTGTLHKKLKQPFVIWGIFTLIGIYALFLSSLPFVRRRSYSLFRAFHFIGIVLVLVCVNFHRHQTRKFIAVAAGLYGADLILRFTLRQKITKAYLYAVPELGMTRVEIPSIRGGWRAGQHIRLRVLTGMGPTMWFETHPFSIVSVSSDNHLNNNELGDGLVLMCKRVGGWTERLYALASSARSEEKAVCVRVSLDGPYGGLADVVLTNYTAALLVAGGSGITFSLGLVEDMVQKASRFQTNLRIIHLVWIVKNHTNYRALAAEFESLNARCIASGYSLRFKVSIFCTRESITSVSSTQENAPILREENDGSKFKMVDTGRPDLPAILDTIANDAAVKQWRNGISVCVCGPVELAHKVRESVRKLRTRSQVGGVYLHEETFGW